MTMIPGQVRPEVIWEHIPVGSRVRAFVRAAARGTQLRQYAQINKVCGEGNFRVEYTYFADNYGTAGIKSHHAVQKMLSDAVVRKFDVLLLEDACRLSRDVSTQKWMLDQLEPYVRLVTFEGRLLTRHHEFLCGFMTRQNKEANAARRASLRARRKLQAVKGNGGGDVR